MQLTFRAPEDHGSVYNAGCGTVACQRREGDLGAFGAGTTVDVFSDLRFEARIPGWRGGPGNRQHGGAVQFRQVREGQIHEPRQMKTLHVDTGREMRGGQWQALYLIERLKDATLLARAGSPLLQEAQARCLDVRELSFPALARLARQVDVVHAHDARAHTLAAMGAAVAGGA